MAVSGWSDHRRRVVVSVAASAVLASTWVGTGLSPAAAEVSSVGGGACGYHVNVGLFGGPQSVRGCGQVASAPASAASPSVSLPQGGSADDITAHDSDGALAKYGPAVIFGGIWPENVAAAPPSGPISVTTKGTPEGGSVTSTAAIVLNAQPVPVGCAAGFSPPCTAPGGIGPGPLIAGEARSTCTASESGVTGSASFVNGILETKYDTGTQEPIVTEPIPANPPPNYTRSGTIDHVGDRFTVVFNEQIIGPDSITVNAAHMYLLGDVARGDMVVGSSTCRFSSDLANRTPVAGDDSYAATTTSPLRVGAPGLLANDIDPHGHPVSAARAQAVFVPGPDHPAQSAGNTYLFPSDPPHGTVAIDTDGSFTYTPDGDFAGVDTFQYVVRDARGAHDTATVSLQVSGNRAPAAADDRYSKVHGVPLNVPAPGVLGNDTEADGDPIAASSASDPPGGTVVLEADGSFVYVPDPGFTGTDAFTYVVSDDQGGSDTALVKIKSAVVTAAPVAGDDTYGTREDKPLTVPAPGVLGNDTDADGDTLMAGSASEPPNGTISLGSNGAFTYTPDAGFTGTDTFTYVVRDGSGGSDTATVTINVNAVPRVVSVGDVSVSEGDAATRGAVFTVSLSVPSASTVTVDYTTAEGTAAAPDDYAARSGTLSLAPGVTNAKVKVPVTGDTVDEDDETFTVDLSGADGAVIGDGSGAGTIVDDDPRNVTGRRVAIGDVSVHEGDAGLRAAVFTVSLSKASTSSVKVSFATANGTATKVLDYTKLSGTLSFSPGTTSMTINVPIEPDELAEGNETFAVNLSAASGATITDASGVGTVVDDD